MRNLSSPVAVLIGLFTTLANAQTTFTDVTSAAKFSFVGESWGASWGDFNGDGWPDLFVNHHRQKNGLYKNLGNGTFADVTDSVPIWAKLGDSHGGTWADFDNDGDQDLFVAYGVPEASEFLQNDNGVLTDRSQQYLAQVPVTGARQPIALDFSGNGLLDVILTTDAKIDLFEQTATSFADVTANSGLSCDGSQEMYFADVTRDHKLDLICAGNKFASKVYNISTGIPFSTVNSALPIVSADQAAASADFNGDLVSDFFIPRGNKRLSGADQVGPKSMVAQLIVQRGAEKSATFVSQGNLSVTVALQQRFSSADVWMGSSGAHPAATVSFSRGVTTMKLNLSQADPKLVGTSAHTPSTRHALYVSYDPTTHRWSFIHAPGSVSNVLTLVISSTAAVSAVASTIAATDKDMQPALLTSSVNGYADIATSAGLGRMSCVSAAAADLDNDGDVDLYVVCRGANRNLANRYFDNDGTGRFVEVAGSGGAAGPVGYGAGLGENVVTADYDGDGDVDLFVTNGLSLVPLNQGGPDLLFKNNATSVNHWLELDLVATNSNRDAFGARVTLKAANGREQLREQNGGYHRYSQHDKRLHFGLGSAPSATLTIEWPSGRVDVFTNVLANHIYQATEAGSIVAR